MNSSPLLSIVVPVYRVEEHVEACLRSVLSQGFSDWEMLLVDDMGGDASIALAMRAVSGDPRVTVLRPYRHAGLGAARNLGVANAQGEYVMFLDSDDELAPMSLRRIADVVAAMDVDIAIFDHVRRADGQEDVRSKNSQRFAQAPQTFTAASFPQVLDALAIAPGKAYRRTYLEELGIEFTSGYYEDIPWTVTCLAGASAITYIDFVGYVYRQRAGQSILGTQSDRHFDVHRQYRTLFDHLEEKQVDDRVVARIYSRVARQLWLVVSPSTNRIRRERRRAFVRASRSTLWQVKPTTGVWLKNLRRSRHLALATGSYLVFRLMIVLLRQVERVRAWR